MKRHLFALARHNKLLEERGFDGFLMDDDTMSLIKQIKDAGWDEETEYELPKSFKHCLNGSSYHVYVGKNFVVKSPLTCGNTPSNACPTKILKNHWRVQPVVKVFAFMKYEEQQTLRDQGLLDRFDEMMEGAGEDCHGENFGLLKGKLVQFDW